jgi:diguanylate cyclase (GGDEF)-like protein
MQTSQKTSKSRTFLPRDMGATSHDLSIPINQLTKMLSPKDLLDKYDQTNTELDKTLKYVLLAMEEAEKRIKRQENRIKYLESLSVTDELTQLLNRRGFLMQFRYSLSISRRTKTGGALMILDLDGFKNINDSYGHAAGDNVLECLGSCLSTNVRDTDFVGRIGGDEFSILMPGATRKTVTSRITRIHTAINKLHFPWNNKNLSIKASIGRYDYASAEKEQDILDYADANMYKQKLP